MSDISRVVFFCPDKKVGEVLRLLTGIALQTPEVTPVVNAKTKRNGLVEETRGTHVEMFEAWLKKKKLKEVDARIGKEYCNEVGIPNHNYLFAKSKAAGLLRRTGKSFNSKWKVIR